MSRGDGRSRCRTQATPLLLKNPWLVAIYIYHKGHFQNLSRRRLHTSLRAYERLMQPSNKAIVTVLQENTVPEDRKGLRREASKLSAIKQDTETDEDLLAIRRILV
ncbi:uncharacterized protein FTOL_03618 [Fusarium torulosum]|uniref:Uncharacterized protein n=1 Tax=Fusarium torulosum TaxID=33205 RepID=A0AAE8SFE8_9HYPO|nr:uncharacterized protein FTOL_03618 [Fusarium torulosum]